MRLLAERALRVTAVVAVSAWIWLAMRPGAAVEVTRESGLTDALARWTLTPTYSVHVRLDTVPDARSRDWLAALRRAGTGVSWWTDAIGAVAVETYAATEPAGGAVVLAATPARLSDSVSGTLPAVAILSDDLGPLDTLAVGHNLSLVRLGDPGARVTLTSGAQPARTTIANAATPRRVLVAGPAGWETKFIITALEEAGWQVDANMFVGPGNTVTQNDTRVADTSRHAAVVLIDSAAAGQVRGVEPFVRQGGGVVLVGDANRSPALAVLVRWRAGRRENAPLGTVPGDTAWRGLTRVPLDTVAAGAGLSLESRDGHPVVIARRHYAGRVVGVGYDETWRWRMAGGVTSVQEHRDWWSRLVASVALRPPSATARATGAAPLASLYATLGAPRRVTAAVPGVSRSLFMNLLGAVALASLLAEWLVRRLRGAR